MPIISLEQDRCRGNSNHRNRLDLYFKYNMRKYRIILSNRKDVQDTLLWFINITIIDANLYILLLITMSIT